MRSCIHDVIIDICVIFVLYCRTLSDGVGAEKTDGVTVVEGGGGNEGGLVPSSPERPENGEKSTTLDLLAKCKEGRRSVFGHLWWFF